MDGKIALVGQAPNVRVLIAVPYQSLRIDSGKFLKVGFKLLSVLMLEVQIEA